ncbi:MAG: NADPH-dependent F420 reductase [Vicinamibacteria bacterium]
MSEASSVAILGGTGKEGQALALRFASRGRPVILGSRDAEKGRRVAEEIHSRLGGGLVTGATNAEAARLGRAIVSTLPYGAHVETASELREALAGKLVVTATIRWPPALDGKPSAAEELAGVLGETARVAAAFQTVSAGSLRNLDSVEREDVLVFAELPATRQEAVALVADTGLRGVQAGNLSQTRVAEALTGMLLGINKLYGVRSTGIRITGLPAFEVEE